MTAAKKLTAKIRVDGERMQHACAIIEHIINPALRDYGITVKWQDQTDPKIRIDYDPAELRTAFEVRRR